MSSVTKVKNELRMSNLSWKNPVAIIDGCNKIILIVITDVQVNQRREVVAVKQVLINAVMSGDCLYMFSCRLFPPIFLNVNQRNLHCNDTYSTLTPQR